MTRIVLRMMFWSAVCLGLAPVLPAAQSNLTKLKSEYRSVTAQLQKHTDSEGWWIDNVPESPRLLSRQWTLAGEWVAAWLNAHPYSGPAGVGQALRELDVENIPDYLNLSEEAFLVSAPTHFGNVFIVAKSDGKYRLAWSTAEPHDASAEHAAFFEIWRPEFVQNSAEERRVAASEIGASIMPWLGSLPGDSHGHARFYIDGMCLQCNGTTTGFEISLWNWDGSSARLLISRDYGLMIDSREGTRVEGNLLKVREKTEFHTFFVTGPEEERKTDWIVRLTPEGIEDLGETSLNPELDVVDELFFRLIHQKQASDIAAPSVTRRAEKIVRAARKATSPKEWNDDPRFGELMEWSLKNAANGQTLCMDIDGAGLYVFTLKQVAGKPFISNMTPTDKECVK